MNSEAEIRRQLLESIIDDLLKGLPDDLLQLEPKDRVRMLVSMLPYVMPKLSEIKSSLDVSATDDGGIKIEIVGDGQPKLF